MPSGEGGNHSILDGYQRSILVKHLGEASQQVILETLSYLKKIVQSLGNAPGIAKIIEKRPELTSSPARRTAWVPGTI